MVKINALRESMFEVDKTHLDLCEIEEQDSLYPRLLQFFATFAQYAHKNVQFAFRQIPHKDLANMPLRAKPGLNSMAETLSIAETHIPEVQQSSPSNILSSKDHELSGKYGTDEKSEMAKGVRFPFSYTSSISRNRDFYGRADILDKIDEAFGLSSTIEYREFDKDIDVATSLPKSYVLCGMAGIGKTETAVEYFYSRRNQFDAVIFIHADTSLKLSAQFIDIAKEIVGEASEGGMDEISARAAVKKWLADPVGRYTKRQESSRGDQVWLIVYDNADNLDVLHEWLPEFGPGCILVTSRRPLFKESAHILKQGIDLEPFSTQAGGEMLRKLSMREGEANALDVSARIVDNLGGHPLAIFHMSAIIREKHLTLQDFEDWYSADSKYLHNLKHTNMSANYQHTLGTVFAIERMSTRARILLNVLSILDPDKIPEEILMDGAQEIELKDYPVKKYMYFDARSELIQVSLISRNMATNEIRIHRLVQTVIRDMMTPQERQAVFAAAAVLISTVWPWVSGTDPTRNQLWRIPIAEKYTQHICQLEKLFGAEIKEGKFNGTATSGYIFCSYSW